MAMMIIIIIALILLIIAIIYNYTKKESKGADPAVAAEEDTKKEKVVGALSITATVLVAIGAIFALWSYSVVSKTTRVCLAGN